ncbi:MAG: hypothetical protein A2583_07595 [Bdellovibrionales bacterium RIFOXYD1_FULL_53_11]|nr:MAG: hypothetical protein A2583_07595 [Bdellovibrionales bacterium RIFOXYD1_FULL_53_11]
MSFSASVDQQTGALSVFDIVEEIRTQNVPLHLQSLVISISLEKTNRSAFAGKVFIHILTPDGKQAVVGNGDMQVPAEQKRVKAVFRFGGFPIMQFGDHRMVVSWLDEAGTKQGEAILDFEVIQVSQMTKTQMFDPSGKGQLPN